MTSASTRTTVASSVVHPLDPVIPAEIEAAVARLRERPELGPRTWVETVALAEPDFAQVEAQPDSELAARTLYVCAYDPDANATWRGEIGAVDGRWRSFEQVPGVQARITIDEFVVLGERVKQAPEFIAALARRGIHDPSLVLVEPWGVGSFGEAEEAGGRRLVYTHCWVRDQLTDNAYARPVAGLHALMDANTGEIVRLDDDDRAPLAPEAANFRPGSTGTLREDVRALQVHQPDGASFRVDGYRVEWQKWSLRIGFGAREGLILWDLRYRDDAGGTVRERQVLRRASMAEMVVPYGSPEPGDFRRNAFDCGEYGIGRVTDSLSLGCDCLGQIHYFDVTVHDWHGRPMVIEQAVCLHEEDAGILFKHGDDWHARADVRRSRRLVISFVTTVGNYVYAVYWYLYQDASIACEVKLTGIILGSGLRAGERPRFGTQVAPLVQAHVHQHVFCFRLDTCIDGPGNSVSEVDFHALPMGPGNPHGNAIGFEERVLATELAAKRRLDLERARYWKVLNPGSLNRFGQPVAFKLMPGGNALPFAHPDSSIGRRAGFMYQHLWVTPYARDEQYPAGWFPNQHPGGDGLPAWTAADRPLQNRELVLWYVLNYHHLPRPEDWPVQPVAVTGFSLAPDGFFDRNPALDVPPAKQAGCHGD